MIRPLFVKHTEPPTGREEKQCVEIRDVRLFWEEGLNVVVAYACDVRLHYTCMKRHEPIYVICYTPFGISD